MAALRGKISLSAVKALLEGDEMRDRELKGFGVRRQGKSISYFVHTRINGRLKRITIGRHGSPWTPELARKRAASLLVSIRAGADPARERDERRQQKVTFNQIAQQFLEEHAAGVKPSTLKEYRRLVRLQLTSAFGSKAFVDIDATSVVRAHASWQATPRTANHALSVLSAMITWAQERGHYPEGANPCGGVKRFRETKRDRFLSDTELRRLGLALDAAEQAGENPFVIAAIRLLLLTGARLSEVLTLRWDYVDEERRVLKLPDSKTGAKTIRLNEPSLAVLRMIPRLSNSPWVLPGHVGGRHLVDIRKPWMEICSVAELNDVRLHDLRHSFASVAVTAGGTLPLIGNLLGHSQAQTTARYAHVAPSPAQALAETTGRRIAEAMAGRSTSSKPRSTFRKRLKLRPTASIGGTERRA